MCLHVGSGGGISGMTAAQGIRKLQREHAELQRENQRHTVARANFGGALLAEERRPREFSASRGSALLASGTFSVRFCLLASQARGTGS